MIKLKNHPKVQKGSGLYRTVIVVEVLSSTPVEGMSLANIDHEIMDGGSSGRVETLDVREISRKDMAHCLEEQGSDPSFLLGDDESDNE